MKLTTFLLLATILHVSGAGYSQKVTLNAKNMHLREVFAEIITQTGVSIIYSEKVLSNTLPVTFQVKEASVQEVLDICLRNQQIVYALEGKNFVIKKQPLRGITRLRLPTRSLQSVVPSRQRIMYPCRELPSC